MADISKNEKPCTVQAGQGFSVIYKGRYLYSKYAPTRAILQTINTLTILPGSLVLCVSPCLLYGIPELLAKLPQDCLILGCETNPDLYNLTKEQLQQKQEIGTDGRFIQLTPEQTRNLPALVQDTYKNTDNPITLPFYTFKRIIPITCSAGISFDPDTYSTITSLTQNIISQYWKNRLTLIQFGRLYAHNLFRNLAKLATSVSFEKNIHSIAKPILVLGAGESCEKTLTHIQSIRDSFFIIAVDAALPALLQHGITADAIAAMEGQLAIEKAYIGSKKQHTIIFADLVSRTHVLDITDSKPCFFTSEYAHLGYLHRLQQKQILPTLIPPLGSIGLTAVQLALLLRTDNTIPVFVSGLDFSYSIGLTHMRGAPAHTARLITANKLTSVPNYYAAYGLGAYPIQRTNGTEAITSKSLEGYATQFSSYFAHTPSLYTLEPGVPLGIPQIDITNDVVTQTLLAGKGKHSEQFPVSTEDFSYKTKITDYLQEELQALHTIKDLLMHGQNLSKQDFDTHIMQLLTDREYLYVHFPDGYAVSTDTSFLKRIRSQIDFFEKDIQFALSHL